MRVSFLPLLLALCALICLAPPLVAVPTTVTPRAMDSLRADTLTLLEDLEGLRMLAGNTMWLTHDLRNFALSGEGSLPAVEAFDLENLRLYELLKPVDYGGTSLWMALDLGDDRTGAEDLAFLRQEVPVLARQVLAQYRKVQAEHAAVRQRLLQAAQAGGLQVRAIDGKAWEDPVREYQRQAGVQIGWRTIMEPPADFREAEWNYRQKLDIRYQLKKAQMLGVTFIVFKDPVLRWDMVEAQKGRYDFLALDRMMALAKEHGLKVRLVLPTMGGRVPDWLLAERQESVIPDKDGKRDYELHWGTGAYTVNFMGPNSGKTPWFAARAVNLQDMPTRGYFAAYVQAIGDHCRKAGYADDLLAVSIDLFHSNGLWRVPPGVDERQFILQHYQTTAKIARKAFAPVPLSLEVVDGEAHAINNDQTAHEWRSAGLGALVEIPATNSETPFYEDLLRGNAKYNAAARLGNPVTAGPFFYQNCEYGFGNMLSINFFTSLLRDGLWSDSWFGPEGMLRWGSWPWLPPYYDRQVEWSGITNGYLAHRQAHLLGPTLANTRVTPGDVLMLLPSSSMERKEFRTNRELVGWGWALTALKMQYDVFSEAELLHGIPAQVRLLILPQAPVLSAAHAQVIRDFVQRGGTLLSSLVPGNDGAAPSPLADVLGCDLLTRDGKPLPIVQTGVKGTWLQVTVPRGLHSGRYTPVPEPDAGYPRKFSATLGDNAGRAVDQAYQALAVKPGATVLHVYGSGEPAVVAHDFGNGRAITMGYPYGQEIFFADWTSIAFGKIYNGWARDPQMLKMVQWLRDTLQQQGYTPLTTIPQAWRYRLQGYEAVASSLAYPRGPVPVDGKTPPRWATSLTYLDPRPAHRISEDADEMDYAAEITWHDRPGIATRYLAIGNRESAYASERATVQFWTMPHRFRVHIADPAIRQVYDIAAEAPVRVQRDARGVYFETTVPPALGRVFAVSTSDTVELFSGAQFPGISADALAEKAVELQGKKAVARTRSELLNTTDVRHWLTAQQGNTLTISYGDAAYRPAAERMAAWLQRTWKIDTVVSELDGRFVFEEKPETNNLTFHAAEAHILIGNAWTNNTIAAMTATWPFNTPEAPSTAAGRLIATHAWPQGARGIVTLSRDLELRKGAEMPYPLEMWGQTTDFFPQGVNAASKANLQQRLLVLASTPQGAENGVKELLKMTTTMQVLQAYEKPGELAPLPELTASLYRVPWRDNVRTASAHAALDGVGVYYKHMPDWSEEEHTALLKQLAAAGIKRIRIAYCGGMYINKDWKEPDASELKAMPNWLRACKAAGIRPCITFVHIPPYGKAGTDELQRWWTRGWNTELLPVDEVGTPKYQAYLEKTYESLEWILKVARDAGFTSEESFDLELGHGTWWGAPATRTPLPATLEDFRPGKRIYEFEAALARRMKAEYKEARIWWAQTHHFFDKYQDDEVSPECAGRAISFYSCWSGITTDGWLDRDQYATPVAGPGSTWPQRPPLRFLEKGKTPEMVLARPESFAADYTRYDNLLALIRQSKHPVAITSLGTVPESIPRHEQSTLNGWEMKERGLTRSLAFWLNQGAPLVLLHSAYEPGRKDNGEMTHSIVSTDINPLTMRWQDEPCLTTLRAFCDGLAGAKPLANAQLRNLQFRYALEPDPVLIPATGKGKALRASDAIALLTFQLDERRFAVAAYVVSPNIAERLRPVRLTLQIDGRVTDDGVSWLHPSNQARGTAAILDRTANATTVSCDITDDVTWLRFELE